jgi:hypothetical protein
MAMRKLQGVKRTRLLYQAGNAEYIYTVDEEELEATADGACRHAVHATLRPSGTEFIHV